jgi:hypothetical protein
LILGTHYLANNDFPDVPSTKSSMVFFQMIWKKNNGYHKKNHFYGTPINKNQLLGYHGIHGTGVVGFELRIGATLLQGGENLQRNGPWS